MSRTVDDAKIESATKRAKLKPSPATYWRAISPGLHIGYRKSDTGPGRWAGRKHVGARAGKAPYQWCTLPGCADDEVAADGVEVLTFEQAVEGIRHAFVAKPPAGPLTVREACAGYVEFLKAERRTGADAEQRLARHVLPKLGDKIIADLGSEEIEKVKRAMVRTDADDPEVERRSKDSANRVLTSLKAALNRAFNDPKNLIPSDAAWRRVVGFRDAGRPREVFLDADQSRRLINVCAGAFRNFVTAALLTGARPPHELAGLRVRDFRADLGTLTIVDGKTGGRVVYLTDEAIKFFTGLAVGRDPDALLVPKDDGNRWCKADHHRPMRAAVAKAKLPKGTTAYSMRHSHASAALLNGMGMQLIAENLGTSVLMIERHYGKFSAASRRALIEERGFKLGLEQDTVTPMRGRKQKSVALHGV